MANETVNLNKCVDNLIILVCTGLENYLLHYNECEHVKFDSKYWMNSGVCDLI